FLRAYREFLGSPDDWDLGEASRSPDRFDKAGLAKVREEYRKRATDYGAPQINDQLRFASDAPDGKPEIAFRFLSAYRLPDAVLFQRTTGPEIGAREFPTGLELGAALGSPFARGRLAGSSPEVMKEVERSRPLLQGESLYAQYLSCLGVLLERTEPDAPEFLRS